MKRVLKREGVGNIIVEDAPIPSIGSRQVLVRNKRTLISPGSEIGSRYLNSDEVDPSRMGYSSAGIVEAVGHGVTEYKVGQHVALAAPHAEYVVGDVDRDDGSRVSVIPDEVGFEYATFNGLNTGAAMWAEISGVTSGDTVAILGQGIVGLLILQALRKYEPSQVITADAYDMRCALSRKFGADRAVNVVRENPVNVVWELTEGMGADVVIDCVGGQAGVKSFAQAQEMCKVLGRIHLISLYHGQPLPLDAQKIQRKLLIGGYYTTQSRATFAASSMRSIADGSTDVASLITHRFSFKQAKEAYDLLYERGNEALGVILTWK